MYHRQAAALWRQTGADNCPRRILVQSQRNNDSKESHCCSLKWHPIQKKMTSKSQLRMLMFISQTNAWAAISFLFIIWLKVPETSHIYYSHRLDIGILIQNPSTSNSPRGDAFFPLPPSHLKLPFVPPGNKWTIQSPGFAAAHPGTVSNVVQQEQGPLSEQSRVLEWTQRSN